MQLNKKTIVRTALFAVLVGALGYSFAAKSETKLLPFQGKLTDANGQVIEDKAIVVQFKMYDAPVGGNAKWNGEVQMLTVNGGLVNTTLGTKASLKNVDFSTPTYLEITIDANNDNQIGPEDPPLLPRQSIIPAVYAVQAGDAKTLSGYDWSSIFGANDPTGKIPGNKLADGSVTEKQIGKNAVTAFQIKAGEVNTAQVANGAITMDKLDQNLANMIQVATPAGTISAFGGENAPVGWLLCDGRAVSSNDYPALYQSISTNWGAGYYWEGTNWLKKDNCDFNLPDLRGLFLRGVNGDRSDDLQDPDAKYRVRHITGSAEGNRVGSNQKDGFRAHEHEFCDYTLSGPNGTPYSGSCGWAATTYEPNAKATNPLYHNTSAAGISETRPKNAYVNYIIKY